MNIPQVLHGGTISGRTCATALPCVERQGILWVYPSPGATDPPIGNIAGEDSIIFNQCVLASSDTEWGNSARSTLAVSRLYLLNGIPMLQAASGLGQSSWGSQIVFGILMGAETHGDMFVRAAKATSAALDQR